ncbi:hypothetical protein H010_02287 [Hydrogenophaga taeniospiralis CCUG 15921]|uniref:Uncharacterized protein n=1 Tax=Hydrogenophaga taeniospiralis CCUG 15921 TaxID=1281780 RepID=A0A9X4S7G4_9BURK|nr:hypothetical protein [Hydrogenophaga taeniospiralis]MDG5974060.1 hypothetical protein [Hydrogenophaga taeniospiralis CCUG 15921]
MSLFSWLRAKNTSHPAKASKGSRGRPRKSFGQTTLPLISPRRGRRILRREQLFSVVRESLIRGGVLSTSYEFKVLTLDSNGDKFLVLVDLALPAEAMPDEYLLEIERWIQASASARHEMTVGSVYWRRKPGHDQHGIALRAAVSAQTRRETELISATSIPVPPRPKMPERVQTVARDEVEAFRRALQSGEAPTRGQPDSELHLPVPESHSDFSALSDTQYGKL